MQSGTPHCCSAAAFRPHLAKAHSSSVQPPHSSARRTASYERDTEYWRTYLTLEGLPVPDDLNDVPFGDPKELPGWVDREDESAADY